MRSGIYSSRRRTKPASLSGVATADRTNICRLLGLTTCGWSLIFADISLGASPECVGSGAPSECDDSVRRLDRRAAGGTATLDFAARRLDDNRRHWRSGHLSRHSTSRGIGESLRKARSKHVRR